MLASVVFARDVVFFLLHTPAPTHTSHTIPIHYTLHSNGTARFSAGADLAGALRRGVQPPRRRLRPRRAASAAMAPDHLQLACCWDYCWCCFRAHAPTRTPRPTAPPHPGLARHFARQFLLPASGPQRPLFRRRKAARRCHPNALSDRHGENESGGVSRCRPAA